MSPFFKDIYTDELRCRGCGSPVDQAEDRSIYCPRGCFEGEEL